MSSLQEALYIAHAIEEVPGEMYVSMGYKNIFGDVEIPKGVKHGVKYLGEVVNNMQSMQLSVNCFELPGNKTRQSLACWMFSVMSSKCCSPGDQGWHAMLWKICVLILDACDKERPMCTIDASIVTKVVGIPLHSICQMFSSIVNDQEACDLESIDSDMTGVSVTDMNDCLVKHTRAKKEFTRKVVHSQRQIEATARAIVKRKRSQSDNIAVAAVAIAEAAVDSVNRMATAANPIVMEHDGADYDRPDETAAGDVAPPAVTVEVTPPPPLMSISELGKGL